MKPIFNKTRFSIRVDFVDEVELDVVSLKVRGMEFERPYIYM